MGFVEAIKLAAKGGKIRRLNWQNRDYFLRVVNDRLVGNQADLVDLSPLDYEATDWKMILDTKSRLREAAEKILVILEDLKNG
jgi:hypothetical protein